MDIKHARCLSLGLRLRRWLYLGLWPMPNMAGMLQLARPGTARPGPDRIVVALFDARSVAHMPAITFTNLYILYLLWHYQWQDCAAGSEQRAAALLTCCLPSLLPTSSNLLSPPSPSLLSHFVAHTSLSLPVPEPRSAMTLHRQNCMLIASSQLQTKPNRTAQLRQLHHTRPGHAPPHSNIH